MAEHGVLAGEPALVTGASRGIGAAISTHLTRAGVTVLVNDSKNEKAAQDVVRQIERGGKACWALVAFLAAPQASFSTVGTINVDGGLVA
jgi:NAD(P)-dependent dehydrogenase (short-subunit alcohol dehydrogenase family)